MTLTLVALVALVFTILVTVAGTVAEISQRATFRA